MSIITFTVIFTDHKLEKKQSIFIKLSSSSIQHNISEFKKGYNGDEMNDKKVIA